MTVLITLTIAGTDSGPFNLYSNLDGYVSAFETSIPKSSLVAGYSSFLVPDSTTTIRVKSVGVCTNYIDLSVATTTTTTTSSSSTTSTTTAIPTTTTTTTVVPTTTTTTTLTPTTTTTTTVPFGCELIGDGVITVPPPATTTTSTTVGPTTTTTTSLSPTTTTTTTTIACISYTIGTYTTGGAMYNDCDGNPQSVTIGGESGYASTSFDALVGSVVLTGDSFFV